MRMKFKVGDEALCRETVEGKWYPAKVEHVFDGSDGDAPGYNVDWLDVKSDEPTFITPDCIMAQQPARVPGARPAPAPVAAPPRPAVKVVVPPAPKVAIVAAPAPARTAPRPAPAAKPVIVIPPVPKVVKPIERTVDHETFRLASVEAFKTLPFPNRQAMERVIRNCGMRDVSFTETEGQFTIIDFDAPIAFLRMPRRSAA